MYISPWDIILSKSSRSSVKFGLRCGSSHPPSYRHVISKWISQFIQKQLSRGDLKNLVYVKNRGGALFIYRGDLRVEKFQKRTTQVNIFSWEIGKISESISVAYLWTTSWVSYLQTNKFTEPLHQEGFSYLKIPQNTLLLTFLILRKSYGFVNSITWFVKKIHKWTSIYLLTCSPNFLCMAVT